MSSSGPASSMSAAEGGHVPPGLTPPEGFKTIVEGSATALYPDGRAVFYNPAQVYNRDLSTAALRVLAKERAIHWSSPDAAAHEVNRRSKRDSRDDGLGGWVPPAIKAILFAPPAEELARLDEYHAKSAEERSELASAAAATASGPAPGALGASLGVEVVEALAATGLRSVRYASEVPGLGAVVVSDLDGAAVRACKHNVAFNGLDPAVVRPCQADAVSLMQAMRAPEWRVDWLDLDPYGTPSPFIESAVSAVHHGGILAMTATDMIVLAGSMRSAAHGKYGSMAVRSAACHELALRALIFTVATAAARAKRTVEPLLSVNANFYCRIFFRVRNNPAGAQNLSLMTGSLAQCPQCGTRQWQPVGRVSTQAAPGKYGSRKGKGGRPAFRGRRPRITRGGAAAACRGTSSSSSSSSSAASGSKPGAEAGNGADDAETGDAAEATPSAGPDAEERAAQAERVRAAVLGLARGDDDAVRGAKAMPARVAVSPLCPSCGGNMHVAGPYWTGPIHSPPFVRAVREEVKALADSDSGKRGGGFPVAPGEGAVLPGRRLPMEAVLSGQAGAGAHCAPAPSSSSSGGSTAAAGGAAAAAGSMVDGEPAVSPLGVSTGLGKKEAHDAGSNTDETVAASRRRLLSMLRLMSREVGGEELERMYSALDGDGQGVAGSDAWNAALPRSGARPSGASGPAADGDQGEGSDGEGEGSDGEGEGQSAQGAAPSATSAAASATSGRGPSDAALAVSAEQRTLNGLLYWNANTLGMATKMPLPPRRGLAACIINEGFRVSDTHCDETGFKTDAPIALLWDALRTFGWSAEGMYPEQGLAKAGEDLVTVRAKMAEARAAQESGSGAGAEGGKRLPNKQRKRQAQLLGGQALASATLLASPITFTGLTFEPRTDAARAALRKFLGYEASADGETKVRKHFANPRGEWGPQQRAKGDKRPTDATDAESEPKRARPSEE
ncbi:hypothetical protein FNF31_04266 [Cafeteria roenbergensis]|uniref:tRNA (guanine(26)-N(2))-dimethyltransferase n=2 Tax=Cafeteria roenbergensis TaxID=33653 RepID=A0A5A8D7F8_CAFRO|nr:hypothetical protein FNF31_04266 [Cafeteria roenbergensis]